MRKTVRARRELPGKLEQYKQASTITDCLARSAYAILPCGTDRVSVFFMSTRARGNERWRKKRTA